ncbi:zinc-dependent metalloprotease [Nocardioides sp.]|uniref:zinc-dependent metalloprotease n=1 Tax=Nocardioides sp. TaxID=35761 RepID=UPI003516B227
MIDWDLAVGVAHRLAGDGPSVPREEARAVVAELREAAVASVAPVREFTGLHTPPEREAPVLVVDRRAWAQANTEAFAVLMEPLVEQMTSRVTPGPIARGIGSRITGLEVGGLLGFLAGKVLGQFDPFAAPDGRLLLVAPNIVQVERELDVDPHDFRLWVCLHEETHRVQFTAVPWLRDHLHAQVETLAGMVSPAGLDDLVARVAGGLRELGPGRSGGSLVDLLSTPEQRAVLDGVTGMMSLLEGHADVVMDGVGPAVVPSVALIRERFTQRRRSVGGLDRVLRRLLGFEAKLAQYRDGAGFVRGVVDRVGMEQFNAVWAEPAHLPTKAEIADPAAWVTRVLG